MRAREENRRKRVREERVARRGGSQCRRRIAVEDGQERGRRWVQRGDLSDALFMDCEKIRYDPICGAPIPVKCAEPDKIP